MSLASTRAAIVAYGAVSALGEGEAAIDAGDVGEPAPYAVTRDEALAAAGLQRPYVARAALADLSRDRATELLVRAVAACVRELEVALPSFRTRRIGLALGTSSGGMGAFEGEGDVLAKRIIYLAPVVEADLARVVGVPELAPASLVLGACASGTLAIGLARSWLLADRCDVVLAGGFDAVSTFVASGFEALRATAGEAGPRPFRRAREGLALGEGAAVAALVREAELPRPSRAFGWIAGFGASCDAAHLTAPDPTGGGLARAARRALEDAGPGAVELVSAHGTATEANDASEALAIAAVPEAAGAVVHALKGSIGHTLGAAGALETLSALHAISKNVLPATRGEGETTAGVRLLDRAQRAAATRVLKLSAAFGGANGALVLERGGVAPRGGERAMRRPVFVARAVAVVGDDVAARTEVETLARATGQPPDRIARADGLVRITLAAVAALEAEVGALRGATGIVVGEATATLATNLVYLARMKAAGAVKAEPRRFPFTTPNAASGECAVAFGLTGPAFAVAGGAHGGLEALLVAHALVETGVAERIVVVAADDLGEREERGAVATLVAATPIAGGARLEHTGVALRDPAAPRHGGGVALRACAHRGLLPLVEGRPETLEVATDLGIVAKARVFWL